MYQWSSVKGEGAFAEEEERENWTKVRTPPCEKLRDAVTLSFLSTVNFAPQAIRQKQVGFILQYMWILNCVSGSTILGYIYCCRFGLAQHSTENGVLLYTWLALLCSYVQGTFVIILSWRLVRPASGFVTAFGY